MPPPAQYPAPYDPMAPAPYPLNYYGPQSPNGVPRWHPCRLPLRHAPMMHARSGSEVLSPAQTHFSPQGAPPPLPYGPMPPAAYHQNTAPVPMAVPPPPPVHAPHGLQSPPVIYNGPSSAQPFPVHSEAASQYPPLPSIVPAPGPDVNGAAKSAAPEPYMQPYRDGSGNPRRGNGRRGSFASRKPPCFFFPLVGARMGESLSNRCLFVRDSLLVIRDDCRFPHILEPQNQHLPAQNSGRGGHRGPRGHISGSLEQKFGAMSVRDDGAQSGGPNGIERSISADSGRPRFQGLKTNQSIANTKKGPRQLQRVPNADEFPSLLAQ
ncbi:transporter [Salix suchowensis]|nr:transporter [Salix suchowensis]